MKTEQQFRPPTSTEQQLLQQLLTADFVGKEEIVRQLEGVQVRMIDDEGSLELRPSDTALPAPVKKRIPVEAEGLDQDRIHIHFLLHVLNGFVTELEIYKDDGSPIKRMPNADDLEVIVLPA